MTEPEHPSTETTAPGSSPVGLVAGPAVFAVMLWMPPPDGLGAAGWSVAAVAALMAIWWLSQAVPLPATALLPAVLFPLLGVSGLKAATAPYAHPLIFLFLGGFIIALTIERWNLHRRVAVGIIARAGTRPQGLVGGFMLATAGLSMWVSNTATTLMMVPIALSVIAFIEGRKPGEAASPVHDRFARGLLLAIAYAASIGGLATLIGTPPNALLAGYIEQNHGIEIGFGRWMMVGLPLTALMLVIAWALLTRILYRADDLPLGQVRAGIESERVNLGSPGRGEKMTAALFAAVALCWMFRPLLDNFLPISDTGIALTGALIAFAAPVNLKERVFLMDWDHARKLPWGILLLFGGGLSLAGAIASTGLAAWLGALFAESPGMPLVAIIVLITGLVVFLTELTSNTATAAVFVPVAATLAVSMGFDALTFAAPVALAASCAFMMPVATPPNAIVFGAGRLTVMHMCAAGILLNLIATMAIAGVAMTLVPLVFGGG